MKKITVLGSTGSIGTQTLETVDALGDVEVLALTAGSNIDLLETQIRKYNPRFASVSDERLAQDLKIKVSDTNTKILSGEDGIVECATQPDCDLLLSSIVGIAGLKPTISAAKAGIDIALANKETLVTAGSIFMKAVKDNGVNLLPVDSEHCAIFQCLKDEDKRTVKKIIITASGGPFRGYNADMLRNVTKEQALKHPNWSMGAKITIDSATLMNKGLEVIEAHWLFDIPFNKIDVVVHPQSVIHSMVEFCDNAVIAQLGTPDMKLPIQYAISYPDRQNMHGNELDFTVYNNLTFEKPDLDAFKALKLAYLAGEIGGTMPVVLNCANEAAVSLFLNDKIKFYQISELVERAMDAHNLIKEPTLDDVFMCDSWVREYVLNSVN